MTCSFSHFLSLNQSSAVNMGNGKSKEVLQPIDESKGDKDVDTIIDGILLSSEYDYLYAKRRCLYRSEQMEMSPDELQQIKALQQTEMNYEPYAQIRVRSWPISNAPPPLPVATNDL